MINLFFPYYQCGDRARQKEIDFCLRKNVEDNEIGKLVVLIDDNSCPPIEHPKVNLIYLETRPTYRNWIEYTNELGLQGISLLCNSDIYFDSTLGMVPEVLDVDKAFLALSRWDLINNEKKMHPNPHWSQDVWGVRSGQSFSEEMLKSMDFPLGVPRCDNKVAYIYAIHGWHVFNPCKHVKSIHLHETEVRNYSKTLDERIIGGVAYVYPGEALKEEASLQFDIWTKRSQQVDGVNLNRSLEKWLAVAASEQQKTGVNETGSLRLLPCSAVELLEAIREGELIYSDTVDFEIYLSNGVFYFKNGFEMRCSRKVAVNKSLKPEDLTPEVAAIGLIPTVMTTYVSDISIEALDSDDSNFWQYPCATEKQAYENHIAVSRDDHVVDIEKPLNIYIPLPWATYVDKSHFPESYLLKIGLLISKYKGMANKAGLTLKVHSVCQHIHWRRILKEASRVGITDLHISHKDSNSEVTQKAQGSDLELHGWPLIAVNYVDPDRNEGMENIPVTERTLLASFIGSYMSHYLDESRLQLLEAAENYNGEDVLVDLGTEWHFNKLVYDKQVRNKAIDQSHLDDHHQKTYNYNRVLSSSRFSLCPIGAGPNTLRLWESIAIGSVPVLFSYDLSVLEDSPGAELLSSCVFWDKPISSDLFEFLASFRLEEIEDRSLRLIELYGRFADRVAF